MKKALFIFLAVLLVSLSSTFAQNLMDYVLEVKGDVLVIKDYDDMGGVANSLSGAIGADNVDVPAGRVYELRANGWYPGISKITTPADRPCVIMGEDIGRLVQADDSTKFPPLLSGFTDEGGSNAGGISYGNDFTLKNVDLEYAAPDGKQGWAYFSSGVANKTITFENNMMEHNWWVFVQSNAHEGNSFYFRDNYFINMSGRACRRNGGVYDNVNNNTDTMFVENNTHIMAQGYMYKFRNYPINFIYFNHNTFVNLGNIVFETQGYQSTSIVTNNIFVNCQAQPFRPDMNEDIPEQAADQLPQGIIDVAPLPATMEQLDRRWLVQNNLAYWDPRISDMAAEANAVPVNGFTTWLNQTMIMNDRTKALFEDNAKYPHMTSLGWIENKVPNFADPKDLLTDQVDILKSFCLATVDTTSPDVLPVWRVTNDGSPENMIYADWPIPVDLSYDDADLVIAGTDGLPVGDLNWFPAQKATFVENYAAIYAGLVTAMENGDPVTDVAEEFSGNPTKYTLSQNYPNPFNPSTEINFSIPEAGIVTLKVYNSLGQEIATLVDGFKNAQNYKVTFDATRLSSGVYYYSLSSKNFVQTKKMVLMK